MLDKVWLVAAKETFDNLRDRRSVLNAFGTVLFNPLFYIILFGFMNASINDRTEQTLKIPVVGAEHAPNLVSFLAQNNATIQDPPADPTAAVRAGDVDFVLRIPHNYDESFTAGQTALIELIIDDSSQSSGVAIRRLERLLNQYSFHIGSLRLIARGVSPTIINTIEIDRIDVANQSAETGGFALNLLPTVMITAAFFGGFFLAVDVTAGEKERQSLEPLLTNPIPRWVLLMGKFVAVFLFTFLATAVSTTFFTGLLAIPQIQDWTGVRTGISAPIVLTAILTMLPVVFMASALQTLVAAYSKSIKEAQTYVQVLALFGFMPTIFLSVLPIQQQSWMLYIPTISQLYLIQSVSRGEGFLWSDMIIATLATLFVAIIALIAAIRLFNQERVLQGT